MEKRNKMEVKMKLPTNTENQAASITIPESSSVSMIPAGRISSEVASMSSFKQDSIVDLYCDDELRMSLEFDEHHLGLGLSEELAVYDLLDDELLPTTATKNLEDSLGEILENWEESSENSDPLTETSISVEVAIVV